MCHCSSVKRSALVDPGGYFRFKTAIRLELLFPRTVQRSTTGRPCTGMKPKPAVKSMSTLLPVYRYCAAKLRRVAARYFKFLSDVTHDVASCSFRCTRSAFLVIYMRLYRLCKVDTLFLRSSQHSVISAEAIGSQIGRYVRRIEISM